MHKTHIFDQKNYAKKIFFTDLPTLFFIRPLQETYNIFFLALTPSGEWLLLESVMTSTYSVKALTKNQLLAIYYSYKRLSKSTCKFSFSIWNNRQYPGDSLYFLILKRLLIQQIIYLEHVIDIISKHTVMLYILISRLSWGKADVESHLIVLLSDTY